MDGTHFEEKGRLNSKFMEQHNRGKRPAGRPRSRWKDQVMKDVRRIKKDIRLANNRKEWRKLVDEAKNLLGFQEPQ